jgi:hypothetical protein
VLKIFIVLFCIADAFVYSRAKYPERTRFIYKLPGGGFIAYLCLGSKIGKEPHADARTGA